jgi:predicted nicotinamide N-methyase
MNSTTITEDFWKIALYDDYDDDERIDTEPAGHHADTDDVSTMSPIQQVVSHDAVTTTTTTTPSFYELKIPHIYGWIHLRLLPLKKQECEVFPLGAEAWYGSALLVALLVQTEEHNKIHEHINDCYQRGMRTINVLELGSGAVGLAGLVAGLSITGYLHTIARNNDHPKCRVILTDHEPNVLQQLEQNIQSNQVKLKHQFPKNDLPEYAVQNLDWNDDVEVNSLLDENDIAERHWQLVIGSELIYNDATSYACINIVLQLLQSNPDVVIVIVQIADRDGWNDIFVPTLRKTRGICVHEESPLTSNSVFLHEVATKLIPHGGTLNRYSDFAVCYIYHGENVVL